MTTRLLAGLAASAVWLGGAVGAAAQTDVVVHGPNKAAQEIVAAERAFSNRFAQVGIAKGMREFMDPVDGLAFAGGEPIRGAAVYAAFGGDAGAATTLSWAPSEVFVSTAGDMGASWGRFTITPAQPGAKPIGGHYVTVWRRGADGAWRALMDIGAPDAP